MDQEVAKTLGDLELKLQELERELTTIGHHDTPAEPLHAPGKLIDEAVEQRGESIGVDARAEAVVALDGDAFGGPGVFGGEEVPSQGDAMIEHDLTVEVRETAYGEIPTPPHSPSSPLPSSSQTMLPAQEQSSTPSGPQSPVTPSELPPPSTPPGVHPPSMPAGMHSPSMPAGMHPPSMPAEMHSPSSPRGEQFPPPHRPDPRRPAAAEENQSVDLAELVRFRDKLAGTMDELIDEYSRLLDLKPPSRPPPDA